MPSFFRYSERERSAFEVKRTAVSGVVEGHTVPRPFEFSSMGRGGTRLAAVEKRQAEQHARECPFQPVTNEGKKQFLIKQMLNVEYNHGAQ